MELNFDSELSHLVYAGADMVIMPSYFEPCGLVQMIALKYGAVPIVRSVGGLADTIHDRDYSHCDDERRNGYVFDHYDPAAIDSALHRAFGLWHHYPAEFRRLMINGMKHDHSWNQAGQDYMNIYEYIRHK
jgi:starch synthase